MDEDTAKFWGKSYQGVQRGSPGYTQFQKRVAKVLTTLDYRTLFQSSLVEDGQIKSGTVDINDDGSASFEVDTDRGHIAVLVENNRIANLHKQDGSINEDVLAACLTRLETISVVTLGDSTSSQLDEKFKASTARDRVLDYMRMKAKDARKEFEKPYVPSRQEMKEIHDEVNRIVARDKAEAEKQRLAFMQAHGVIPEKTQTKDADETRAPEPKVA